MISFSIFLHAFHTFRPRFLGFEIFLGFLKIDELFVKFLGWVLLKWCYLLMHCISFAFLTMFHAFRCVYLLEPCVLVGLDWAKPMMIFLLHVIWSCIIHACIPFISFLLVLYVDWCFSVSLSLSWIVRVWHPSTKLLRPRTLFVPGHHCLIPLLFLSGFVMIKPVKTFEELLQTWHSFGTPRYPIKLLWYYSSNCHIRAGLGISLWDTRELSLRDHTGVFLQYAQFDYSIPWFITFARGTCIVVTPELISDVLHVSKESHPDYLGCPHLWTVSKDKLLSLFYKTPSSWGDCWNTSCSGFAKGPRFLNMVMTFVLHLLSHYNSITKPHA